MTVSKKFVDFIQSVTPGYKVVKKKNSRLMRFLATILFFNKNFMSLYTTTIGSTVYMPEEFMNTGSRNLGVLAHEAQHVWDYNQWYGNIFYTIGYLFPQILVLCALLSLLAIWFSNWWLMSLLCLIFAAPIPAPVRMIIERRGYLMSLAVEWWMYKDDVVEEKGWPVNNFTGPNYYYMWPSRKSLVKWFSSRLQHIKDGNYPSPVFKAVHEFLQSENLTK